MSNEISKKEFLKRYLENKEESSRKRKKKSILLKPKTIVPSLKIVNEDIDLKSMNFGEKADDEDDDEAPVVAEIIDDRPVEVKLKELYDSSHWKKIDSCDSSESNLHNLQKNTSNDRNIKHRRHDSDGDLSPLREKRISNAVSSPQRSKQNKNRHDSDSDISPPRNQKQNRNKHNSDSDLSPHQNQRQNSNRHESDSDLSPPRSHEVSSKNSLPDRPRTTSSEKNAKNRWHDSNGDLSSVREQKQHSSRSHKQSKNRYESDSDVSPPRSQQQNRNKHNSDSDLSPPRSHDISSTKGKNKLDKTLSGLKAGLQNSKSLQQEVQELRQREKSQLNMLDDEISGKNANTIIRDRKTGLKRDLNKEQETKNEEDKKKKEYQQKYDKWGKGTEQRQEHLEKLKDDMYEMSKPLARYEDDADLDERLKSIIHDDDPMSAYMKKKRQKESGTSNHPVYTGPPAPPNRFSINPGFRWDGVDRSNGFEAKYFEKINNTKAVKDEAYLWSVQDM